MIALIPLFEDRSHPMVNEYMQKALACPKCGAFWNKLTPMTENRAHSPRYLVTCDTCKFQGPFGKGLADAVKRWNKPVGIIGKLIQRFRKPKNHPLHKKSPRPFAHVHGV